MCAMEDAMKRIVVNRIIIATALLLGTSLAAQAYPVSVYRDLIRPNGHPRSEAIHQSDLDACYRQTGQSRYAADGPAFKQCMASRGYRFVSQHYAPNPRYYSGSPGVDDWTPPPAGPDPNLFSTPQIPVQQSPNPACPSDSAC